MRYQPAESDSSLFGGNSNWRGPIWFPVNYLIIESLQKFHHYYGDDFKVECPTGSRQFLTIGQVAEELSRRLTRIFLRDESGRRPVLAYHDKLHSDPHFRDYCPVPRVFPRRHGPGCRARRTRPAGPAWWPSCSSRAGPSRLAYAAGRETGGRG